MPYLPKYDPNQLKKDAHWLSSANFTMHCISIKNREMKQKMMKFKKIHNKFKKFVILLHPNTNPKRSF